MGNLYVRSTDGNDADDGSTWALAKATIAGAAAIDAAGDTIFVSQAHSEVASTTYTVALAGTAAAPTRLICASDAAEPPTATAQTAVISATGSINMTVSGNAYVFGLSLNNGTAAASPLISLIGQQVYERCNFRLNGSSSSGRIYVGAETAGAGRVVWKNCNAKLVGAGQFIDGSNGTFFEWIGGALESGTVVTTGLFGNGAQAGSVRSSVMHIEGVDLSAGPTNMDLVQPGIAGGLLVRLRDCKLPAGWTGRPVSASSTEGALKVALWNCSAGSTNYDFWVVEPLIGDVKSDAAVYKTGFSGGTAHSMKLTSTANVGYALQLNSLDLFADNATTGSPVTATVEVVTDGVTLTDGECWLEVMYMSASGSPLGTWISDAKADVLATAAAQTASAQGWTTTGLASPVTQKLSVTFTPQKAGYVMGRVVLAKPSTTVYVDPELKLS